MHLMTLDSHCKFYDVARPTERTVIVCGPTVLAIVLTEDTVEKSRNLVGGAAIMRVGVACLQ